MKFVGHVGAWHSIDELELDRRVKCTDVNGREIVLYKGDKITLWEHDFYGDMAAFVVTYQFPSNFNTILDDYWFDSLEQWVEDCTEEI